MPEPVMSAIVVNYNGAADLPACLQSLRDQGPGIEIIVIDNGSSDGSAEEAEWNPAVRVIRSPHNDGFAGGVNRGAAAAQGDYLLFLNPDVVLERGCVAGLVKTLRRWPGACGPALRHPDGRWERGLQLDLVGDPLAAEPGRLPLYVSGCALATTRRQFTELGGFDERYFMIAEDVDYCWRVLLAGGHVRVAERAFAQHRGGGSTPGGYLRDGRMEVTAFRIALRERNTLATQLKCAPLGLLTVGMVARLTRLMAIGLFAGLTGRGDLAKALMAGLAWNCRQLPQTLQLRRAMPTSPGRRSAVLSGRLHRGLVSVDLLRRYGLPHFVDWRRASYPDPPGTRATTTNSLYVNSRPARRGSGNE